MKMSRDRLFKMQNIHIYVQSSSLKHSIYNYSKSWIGRRNNHLRLLIEIVVRKSWRITSAELHESTKALKGHGNFQKRSKVNRYIELCNPFSWISNSFPWISNSFPGIKHSVLSNCNSFPRIGQLVLSDCNSFPRIRHSVLSNCNSGGRVVQFEGTNR